MQYLGYAVAVWAIISLCGLPFSLVLLPPALRPIALPTAPTFGYCYIVYSGYLLYRCNVGGTDLYAPLIICLPLGLLAFLAWRHRLWPAIMCNRDSILMFASAAVGFMALSSFFLLAHGRAVSMSLGNLDVVEYASEARYLQEFARDTTAGFMGQSDWFLKMCEWLWFGPPMIVAFMSSATFSDPFRLQSLVMLVVASQGASFVYSIARDSLSLDRRVAAGVALLFAVNPVVAYVVWQSFGAQMLAAPLLLAATYLLTRAQAEPANIKTQFRYLPSLVFLYSGLLLTYYFMIGFICALLGTYVTVIALCEKSLKRFWVGAGLLASALGLTIILDPFRIPGIARSFSYLSHGATGWFIAWLSPDVQLGFNAAGILVGNNAEIGIGRILGIFVAGALLLATAVHLIRLRERPAHVAFVIGLAAPALLLGAFYAVADSEQGILGGYRSFKITASFAGFTLIALSLWMDSASLRRPSPRWLAGALAGLALIIASVVNLRTLVHYADKVAFVPTEELRRIQRIESLNGITGISIMSDEVFNLFWAHYFTLRKQQIFQSFPYAGRVVGALTEPYRLEPITDAASSSGIVAADRVCPEAYRVTSRLRLCKSGSAS